MQKRVSSFSTDIWRERDRERERESGLVGSGVTLRIRRVPVQAELGAQPGFESQPRYVVPGDLKVENSIQIAVIDDRL